MTLQPLCCCLADYGRPGRRKRENKFVSYSERITFNPQMMGGQACIRGMRIPVSLVLLPKWNATDPVAKPQHSRWQAALELKRQGVRELSLPFVDANGTGHSW